MNKRTKCYLVTMPIGDDLNDISIKALSILKKVNFIFCESLDFHRRLNENFGIDFSNKKIIPLENGGDGIRKLKLIKFLIKKQEDFVFISDSGIPCFLDPGSGILNFILEHFYNEIKFFPVGVSSALDVALILVSKFCDHGFVFDSKFNKIRFDKKQYFAQKNNLPFILFVDYEDLNALLRLLKKTNFNNKILLLANLAKKEKKQRTEPVYKLFLGDLLKIKNDIRFLTPNDDIIIVLLPSLCSE